MKSSRCQQRRYVKVGGSQCRQGRCWFVVSLFLFMRIPWLIQSLTPPHLHRNLTVYTGCFDSYVERCTTHTTNSWGYELAACICYLKAHGTANRCYWRRVYGMQRTWVVKKHFQTHSCCSSALVNQFCVYCSFPWSNSLFRKFHSMDTTALL